MWRVQGFSGEGYVPKGDLGGEFYAEGILEILLGEKCYAIILGEKLL